MFGVSARVEASARIVCKFGGSSLASASQFRKVQAIIEADPRRSIIVPSAPGKRDAKDAKITDLLYLCQHAASVDADFAVAFGQIASRFLGIERELGLDAGLAAELAALREARDATLKVPALILPSLQINIRAGALPPPEPSGKRFLKLPLNAI